MSRYDYPDPGTDPDYCNPLACEPDNEPGEGDERLVLTPSDYDTLVVRYLRRFVTAPPTEREATAADLIGHVSRKGELP